MKKLGKCKCCGHSVSVKSIEEICDGDSGYFAVNCDFNAGGCGATGGYRSTRRKARRAFLYGERE